MRRVYLPVSEGRLVPKPYRCFDIDIDNIRPKCPNPWQQTAVEVFDDVRNPFCSLRVLIQRIRSIPISSCRVHWPHH